MLRVALIQTIPAGQSKPHVGIGIAYLQSYVQKYEPELEIDLFLNDDAFEREFDPLRYDLVGISSVSYCFNEAIDIARRVKESDPKIPVILGGSHITGFPRSLELNPFDVGVVGEGEHTFLELVRLVKKHGKLEPKVLENVRGVCFSSNGDVFVTKMRDFIEDLNSIPPFDKNFIKRYDAIPFTSISRGCPFDCKYCSSKLAWQSKVRKFSPEYVVRDILELKRLFPDDRRIIFREDTFTVNRKALIGIKERINEIRGEKGISFIGSSHPNFITRRMAELLTDIGVRKLNFGIESGSDRLMRIVKRGSTNLKRVLEALEICQEYGIKVGSSFIIGFPEETEEDLRASYEFIIEKMQLGRLFTTGTLILTPLPDERSEYWQLAVKKYKIDHRRFRWNRLDFRSWHLYIFENNMEGDIYDWWKWRVKEEALYIGGLPAERWLKIIEPYEIEMRKLNEVNTRIDRAAWK